MSDALLRDLGDKVDRLAEQQAAAQAADREWKLASKEIQRARSGWEAGVEQKVEQIQQRLLKGDGKMDAMLAKQDITNGRVNRHDAQVEVLMKAHEAEVAIANSRRWRFTAIVTIVTSVIATLVATGLIAVGVLVIR